MSVYAKKIGPAFIKALIYSAVITIVGALLLAALAMLCSFDEGKIQIGVYAIYIASCFVGGILAGKTVGEKKYIWGLLWGCMYFLILFLAGMFILKNESSGLGVLTTLLMCAGSGMLGGMLG